MLFRSPSQEAAQPVTAGGSPILPEKALTITKDVTFLVVDYSFAYNAILGQATLNSWKVVTSIYHLMIKFPTDYGVKELWGNQVAAHKCYITMLEMDDHQQTMCIEEQ